MSLKRHSRALALAVFLTSVAAVGHADTRSIDAFIARHWRAPLAAQGAPPARFSTTEASLAPEACGSCHPAQLADWSTSIHAQSMGPGIAGQLVEMFDTAPGDALGCLTCHAPLAEQRPLVREPGGHVKNPAFDPALQPRGLVCAGCHVRAHERFGPPRRDGSLSTAAPRESLPHNGVTRTPAFLASEFCRGCHQFASNGFALNGKLLENTYQEWKTSRFAREGVSCQDCHMPDRRHVWRGIHDPDMVRSGVKVTARGSERPARAGEMVVASLAVESTRVGHAFPTYVTPRVVLRGELIDAAGDAVAGTRREHVIAREVALDLSKEIRDTRLRPGGRARLDYRVRAQRAGLRIRLSVVVEPDAFYTAFFETLLENGAGRGEAQIREALAATRRSVFTLFVKELPRVMNAMPTRWPEARARRGMAAAPHALAATTARDVIRDGGNALDAAVAGVADLAVVYPHMNGIGGDSFWLIYDARARAVVALNAAGRAAAAVNLEAYRTRFGGRMPTRGGPAALTVPGTVSGWWAVHRYSTERLGSTMTWRRLLDPALVHAGDGVPLSEGQRRTAIAAGPLFEKAAPPEVQRTLWPIYHPAQLVSGHLVQPDLAATLEALSQGGAAELYGGDLGRRLVAAAAAAGSPLRLDDLTRHRAEWVEPLRMPYRGGVAVSFPPPTQGFAALAILGLLEGFDVASLKEDAYVHLVVEATKLAFEDRDRYLADPTLVEVPVARCLDPDYLGRRRREIDPARARPLPGPESAGDTVALVTADDQGNAVCVIQSLYHEYGSGVVAAGTGIILQNRGAFFSLDPLRPNCLAPGKQTAHTLIPSMYLVDGSPRWVYGTMGGEGQPQTQAALVTRLVDRGHGLQAAVEAPRWLLGRTWGDDTRALRLESRFDPALAQALTNRGHDVKIVESWSDLMGHAQAIGIGPDLTGSSDPRADGAAAGT